MESREEQLVAETNSSARIVETVIKAEDVTPEQKAAVVAQNKAKVEQNLAKLPESSKLNAAAAEFSYVTGDYREGLARADKSVALAERKKDPKDLSNALVTRGRGWMGLGDYSKAALDADAALKANPGNQAAHALVMMTQGRAGGGAAAGGGGPPAGGAGAGGGMPGQAAAPQDAPAGPSAGRLASAGQPNAPAQSPAGVLTPDSAALAEARGHVKKALGALGMGDWETAKRQADEALAKAPRNAEAHAVNAAALNAGGRPAEALAAAERSVELDPWHANGWLQRGLAREKLGRPKDEVLADIAKARRIDPSLDRFYGEAFARLGKDPGGSQGRGSAAPAGKAPAGAASMRLRSCPIAAMCSRPLVIGAVALAALVGAALFGLRRGRRS